VCQSLLDHLVGAGDQRAALPPYKRWRTAAARMRLQGAMKWNVDAASGFSGNLQTTLGKLAVTPPWD
jgi:hypothetical protein